MFRNIGNRFVRPKPKLHFIHIPKTAGMSFVDAMIRLYGRDSYVDLVAKSKQAAGALYREEFAAKNEYSFRHHLIAYQMACGTGFISAHAPFSVQLHDAFPEYHVVTVLRNPVERYLSEYYFNKTKKDGHAKLDIGLEEFSETARGIEQGEILTKYICDSLGKHEANNNSLARAKEILKSRFEIIGFVERLHEFELALGTRLNIKPSIRHLNKSAAGAKTLSRHLRARIEKLCDQDLELYEFAKTLDAGRVHSVN
ncbi:MAG: sulfotransferase family 2 domain-containing protein [Aureliella sp.]